MSKEFENPKNLNEESFKDEAGNLKSHEKQSAETENFRRDRKQIWKSEDTAHRLFIYWLWILFYASVILFAIWFWHLVVPQCWVGHWLKESQLDKIEKILIAAGGCTLVSNYLKR